MVSTSVEENRLHPTGAIFCIFRQWRPVTAPATGKTSSNSSDTNEDHYLRDPSMILRRIPSYRRTWNAWTWIGLSHSRSPAMLRRDSGDLSGEVDHEEQPALVLSKSFSIRCGMVCVHVTYVEYASPSYIGMLALG